jgi:hypothetical protein
MIPTLAQAAWLHRASPRDHPDKTMFRDINTEPLNESPAWSAPVLSIVRTRQRTGEASLTFEERTGELSPVYREIARRIAGEAFTRHASTLGDALR